MIATLTQESLFIAGCIGCLASALLDWHPPQKPKAGQVEVLRTVLSMLLAGYVAAFVLHPDSIAKAFVVGLALTKVLAAMRQAVSHYIPIQQSESRSVNLEDARHSSGAK
jgi:ABC-type iron transport system FetAB permease component